MLKRDLSGTMRSRRGMNTNLRYTLDALWGSDWYTIVSTNGLKNVEGERCRGGYGQRRAESEAVPCEVYRVPNKAFLERANEEGNLV